MLPRRPRPSALDNGVCLTRIDGRTQADAIARTRPEWERTVRILCCNGQFTPPLKPLQPFSGENLAGGRKKSGRNQGGNSGRPSSRRTRLASSSVMW